MSLPHPTLLSPVRTPEELTARWALIAALGADPDDPAVDDAVAGSDLWVQLLDAQGRQQSALVVVEGLSPDPDEEVAQSLAGVLGHLLAEHTAGVGSVAFALVPARTREVVAADLAWAQSLAQACRDEHVEVLGVHLVVGTDAHRVL
jgi:hypothetical protein